MTTGRINQIAIEKRETKQSRRTEVNAWEGGSMRPALVKISGQWTKDPRSSVHAPRESRLRSRTTRANGRHENQASRGLHAPTKARQITRCGPTAHRESGDSARQFVKPPYEQDACAIISSRQRLLASDTYTGAPTPCGHQNALTGLFCREIHRLIESHTTSRAIERHQTREKRSSSCTTFLKHTLLTYEKGCVFGLWLCYIIH